MDAGQRRREVIGVALNDADAGIAPGEDLAEIRIELDGDDALGRDAFLQQRPRDDAGSRTKLEDRTSRCGIDMGHHAAREGAARRRDGAGGAPGADEADDIAGAHAWVRNRS